MKKVIVKLTLAFASLALPNCVNAVSFSPEMNNKIRTMQIDAVIQEIETKLYPEMESMLEAYNDAWKKPRENGQQGNYPKCLGMVVAKARELKEMLQDLEKREKSCGRPNEYQLNRITQTFKKLNFDLNQLEMWVDEINLSEETYSVMNTQN